MTVSCHLAQVNVAHMAAPLDSPAMADFVLGLEPINALADAAPGFVWRLQSDQGNATDFRAFDDNEVLINLSVWESIDALRAFTYRSDHVDYLRRRNEWFRKIARHDFALWWVEIGHQPTVVEAVQRLEHLRLHGETAFAFTFRQIFPQSAVAEDETA